MKQKVGEPITLSTGGRTIVNPRKLPPQEQLSVCQQCHLQGKASALNGASSWFDFRPGTKLETNRSVYFPAATQKEIFEVADSPHRLSLSRCFKESRGAMTCISCHDPHRSIKSFTKDYYNQKCLGCHRAESLSVRDAVHIHSITQNCISCHMNSTGSDNTLHGVSNTDHWIRVDASNTVIDWTPLRTQPEKRPPIFLVHDVEANDGGQLVRQGIAYLDYYKEHDRRRLYLDSALHYLTIDRSAKKDSYSWFSLGEVYEELGRLDDAIHSYERAVAIQPMYAEAFFKLGRAYAGKKIPELAVRAMRKAVQLKPSEPLYLEGLGSVLASQGKIDEAVTALRKSLTIDNLSASAHYSLGILFAIDLKQPKKALTHFKQLVVLDPDFPGGFLSLGNTFFLLKRYSEALDAYHNELANNPRSALALVNVGRILMLTGKNPDARRAFERALAIDPSLTLAKEYLRQLR